MNEKKRKRVIAYVNVKLDVTIDEDADADDAVAQVIEDMKNGFSPAPAHADYIDYKIDSIEKERG
jgi:hypothetical protein